MKGIKTLTSRASDEWATPQDLFDSLDAEFHFTLDPCATEQNHKCANYCTKEADGLSLDWGGAVSILQSSLLKDRSVGQKSLL